jgi:hypothetical protein
MATADRHGYMDVVNLSMIEGVDRYIVPEVISGQLTIGQINEESSSRKQYQKRACKLLKALPSPKFP